MVGVAQIGEYKCHLTGGDLNLDGDVQCDAITLGEHFIKCRQGEQFRDIQYTKKCFDDSKETILENDATAIKDSSRRPEVVKPFDNSAGNKKESKDQSQ